jgi:hypothetical protein
MDGQQPPSKDGQEKFVRGNGVGIGKGQGREEKEGKEGKEYAVIAIHLR